MLCFPYHFFTFLFSMFLQHFHQISLVQELIPPLKCNLHCPPPFFPHRVYFRIWHTECWRHLHRGSMPASHLRAGFQIPDIARRVDSNRASSRLERAGGGLAPYILQWITDRDVVLSGSRGRDASRAEGHAQVKTPNPEKNPKLRKNITICIILLRKIINLIKKGRSKYIKNMKIATKMNKLLFVKSKFMRSVSVRKKISAWFWRDLLMIYRFCSSYRCFGG